MKKILLLLNSFTKIFVLKPMGFRKLSQFSGLNLTVRGSTSRVSRQNLTYVDVRF